MKFLGILFNRMVEAAKKNEKTIDVLIANKMKEEKKTLVLLRKKNSAIYFELIVFLFFYKLHDAAVEILPFLLLFWMSH